MNTSEKIEDIRKNIRVAYNAFDRVLKEPMKEICMRN